MTTTTNGKATELITFSRGSLATVTDADGKIKWAPHNLLLRSEQLDNTTSWSRFGFTIAAPTVTANAAAAPNGTTTAEEVAFPAVSGSSDTSLLIQSLNSVAAAHAGGIWMKAKAAGDVGKQIVTYVYDTAYVAKVHTTLTADWQLVSLSGTATSAALQFSVGVVGTGAGGVNQGAVSVYLWGASLTRADLGGMQSNPSAYPYYNPSTPRNLLGYSEDWSNAYWSKSGLAATPVIANAIAAPNGSLTADKIIESTAASAHVIFTSYTASGGTQTFSVYAKAGERSWMFLRSGANIGAYFNLATGVKGTEDAGVTATITSVGDGWHRCAITLNVPAGAAYPTIFITTGNGVTSYTGDGVSGIYLWGAQLSDSASLDPYVPNFGAAPSAAAAHGARLDYRNGSALGLLVEETRTNLALNSAAVAGASYTLRNTTIDANAAVAPDGTSTATKLKETDGSNFFDAYQGITITNGAVYTVSVYAKAAERNWIWVQAANGANKTWFNLSTGVVGTNGAGNTAVITNAGNGWYRCSVTLTAGTTTGYVDVGISNADNTVTYTGVAGNGVYVWGAQLEAGSFATSYIPTAASTVTRNADVASVGVSQFPYSSSASSLVVAFDLLAAGNPSPSSSVVSLDNGSLSQFLVYKSQNSAAVFIYMDAASVSLGNVSANTVVKAAIAGDGSSNAGVLNGGSATALTSTMPATATTMNIGQNWGLNRMSGHIRQITYLPRRLSNAELQSRTA